MDYKKSDKIIKRLYIIAISIGIVVWLYNYNEESKELRVEYKKSSFKGVIKDTVHYPMQHDLPTYIFTNGSSHLSNLNEIGMQGKAKVGDSLSKEKGNDTVYVFRKEDLGQYFQIYPKQ